LAGGKLSRNILIVGKRPSKKRAQFGAEKNLLFGKIQRQNLNFSTHHLMCQKFAVFFLFCFLIDDAVII